MYMRRFSVPNASPTNIGILLTLLGILVFSLLMNNPYEGFDIKEGARNKKKSALQKMKDAAHKATAPKKGK